MVNQRVADSQRHGSSGLARAETGETTSARQGIFDASGSVVLMREDTRSTTKVC
jgi:hypothetical protein